MDPISALITGGASLLGGGMQSFMQGQKQGEAQTFNAEQALQQENFQYNMATTAYQKSMADMKAAGLNPILAYGKGGAATPSGAAASTVAQQVPDMVTPAVNSALAAQRVRNETLMNEGQIAKVVQEVNNLASSDKVIREQAKNIAADTALKGESLKSVALEGLKSQEDSDFYKSGVGSWIRKAGTALSEVGRVVSPVTSAASGAARAAKDLGAARFQLGGQ